MTVISPSDPRHSDQLISTGGLRARRVIPIGTQILGLSTHDDLISLCQKNSEETCGFLTFQEDIFLVKNSHVQPQFNFYMDEESFKETVHEIYQIKKSKIMGIFHTHPNNQPWPSPRDIAGWPNRALNWRYWIATRKELIEWELYVP